MPQTDTDRIIALAGLAQATQLVTQLAHQGRYDSALFETQIHSLFQVNAINSADVYGGMPAIRNGLEHLVSQLRKPVQSEATTYAISLMGLEAKLSRRKDLMQRLSSGVVHLQDRLQHFPASHENIIAGIADLYTQTAGQVGSRIMVRGESSVLSQESNANKIRALLLSGLRAIILWRQSGGNKWALIFRYRKLLAEAEYQLKRLT